MGMRNAECGVRSEWWNGSAWCLVPGAEERRRACFGIVERFSCGADPRRGVGRAVALSRAIVKAAYFGTSEFALRPPLRGKEPGEGGYCRFLRHVSYRLVVVLLLVCTAIPALAQNADPAHGAETEAVARAAMVQLRSPVTPSHTLDMCPAAEAAALRDTVMLAAAAGKTTRQIVEDVIARRGEQLRIVPRKRGFGLWAWLVPPAVLLLGASVVWGRLRKPRSTPGETPAGIPPRDAISAEDRLELAAALQEWERVEAEA